MQEILPGQLWRWNFTVGDGSWFLTIINEKSRTHIVGDTVLIQRGDVLLVVSQPRSGEGPYGYETSHWLTALFKDRLVWVKLDDLVAVGEQVT